MDNGSVSRIGTTADLVQRAINGERGAFGMLYEQRVDQVYRYVVFHVHDADDAKDLTQDVPARLCAPARSISCWPRHATTSPTHREHK